jgi:hypothetical protein
LFAESMSRSSGERVRRTANKTFLPQKGRRPRRFYRLPPYPSSAAPAKACDLARSFKLAARTAAEDDKGSLGADATVRFDLNEVRSPARSGSCRAGSDCDFAQRLTHESRPSGLWPTTLRTSAWSGKRTPPKRSARFARDPGMERGARSICDARRLHASSGS